MGRTRTSDMQPRRATPLPCDHQSTMLKADKRGISTPLISAVSPAAAPFQTSCALLISPFFFKLASVRTRTCSPCLHMPPYPASWFYLPNLYLKRMTRATDSSRSTAPNRDFPLPYIVVLLASSSQTSQGGRSFTSICPVNYWRGS